MPLLRAPIRGTAIGRAAIVLEAATGANRYQDTCLDTQRNPLFTESRARIRPSRHRGSYYRRMASTTQLYDGRLAPWAEVKALAAWDALLLGNGMSINVWPGFEYESLYKEADLSDSDRETFRVFNTRNFEAVLLDDGDLRLRFYGALRRAGLGHKRQETPALRFHDLRHTFGTLAVQAWPLVDVQAYMGHANIATTMIYAHHVPKHDAADALTRLVREGDEVRSQSPARSL